MDEIRGKNRIYNDSIHSKRKLRPQIVFSSCTYKQSIEISFLRAKKSLQEISTGDLSKIIDLEQHNKFMTNSKFCNEFFSIFPFDFFLNQILLNDAYSLPSLNICARCITSKFCPLEFLNLISHDLDLAKYLCSTVLPKNDIDSSISCFHFFSAMALSSPNIKDFLLDSDIIFEKINQYNDDDKISRNSKRFFLINASNFIYNCLTSSISDENKLNNISQIYFIFLSNENELVVAHAIKLLKKMKKNTEIESSYPDIISKSLDYVNENYLNAQSPEITLAVYSLLQGIDSLEYMKLTLDYIQESNSPIIIKKCLSTMIKRNEEWSLINNEEVCQILINMAQTSSFIVKKQATKVLMLYWDHKRMISSDFFNLLTNFLREKDFGILCMNTILSFLNNSFSQNDINSFVAEVWNEDIENIICDIEDNGNDEESSTALLLLEAFRNYCS